MIVRMIMIELGSDNEFTDWRMFKLSMLWFEFGDSGGIPRAVMVM